MGNKCTRGVDPLKPGVVIISKNAKKTIREKLCIPRASIFLSDRTYKAYDFQDYARFLKRDLTDKKKYLSETFDCDDFSLALMTEAKKWSKENTHESAGCCFGMVWGDIRTDERPNPHAVNFFIDSTGELWLVEPQTDMVFKPTPNSTFWMCLM